MAAEVHQKRLIFNRQKLERLSFSATLFINSFYLCKKLWF